MNALEKLRHWLTPAKNYAKKAPRILTLELLEAVWQRKLMLKRWRKNTQRDTLVGGNFSRKRHGASKAANMFSVTSLIRNGEFIRYGGGHENKF